MCNPEPDGSPPDPDPDQGDPDSDEGHPDPNPNDPYHRVGSQSLVASILSMVDGSSSRSGRRSRHLNPLDPDRPSGVNFLQPRIRSGFISTPNPILLLLTRIPPPLTMMNPCHSRTGSPIGTRCRFPSLSIHYDPGALLLFTAVDQPEN